MSITLPGLGIAFAAWTIASCLALPGFSFAANRFKRRSQPPTPEPLPPVYLPADATIEELKRAVNDALFVDIVWTEFPQYRKDLTGGAA